MGFYFNCGSCKYRFRFKGKETEISRCKSVKCPRCRSTIKVTKKPNGKIVVCQK